MWPALITLVLSCTVFLSLKSFLDEKRRGRLPPGPRGWPLIGNVLDFPTTQQWKTFAQWGEKWGPLMSISLLGRRMVIINSAKVAVEMLDKKSTIYSNRPKFIVAGEMVGWETIGSMIQYGPRYRDTRRLYSQLMGSREKVNGLKSQVELASRKFLLRLLRKPEDLPAQLRLMAASTMLMLAYGYTVQENEDPIVKAVEIAMGEATRALSPGAFLVEVFPILKHVPEWVPGFAWKKEAKVMKRNLQNMCDMPFEFAKKQMAAGTDIPNLTSRNLPSCTDPEREQLLKDAASAIYAGKCGSDTTVSSITSFFLAMMCYPEVQRRAQEEIDTIIGTDRLPTLADRDSLPYVSAVCSEVMRMFVTVPTGFPHVLSEDDVHDGHYLPKDTFIIANIWQFCRDSATYADPFVFNPDRFLSSEGKVAEPDPRKLIFGFGRRVCPGADFADAVIFETCAVSLAVYNVSKPIKDGVTVEPSMEMTSGVIVHPEPFEVSIKPRSAKAEALIRSAEELED
ncbi:uncharacterized protein FIBRA_05521 [Fibroporia radiculosa]|uniref:Cytochrome P450 n=1 Tax=Fibroporia radiculosa TaxID=599839 RepID=J4IAR9_9APHY|nr:uncharacterized protein FIBRA_05521 [Fibroporia radiculosa]CCM03391.1 predicted protein [Fibroporia radiculosa]